MTGQVVVRRRMLAFSTGVVAAAAVAACGPIAPGQPGKPGKLGGKVIFYTRGGEVETRGQKEILIPSFAKVTRDVEVTHEVFAGQAGENYTSKLYTMYAAGTPPDVFGFGQNYMGFWARNMLSDLTPFITRDKYDLDQFLTGLPDKFKVKGKYYGVPQLTTFGTLLFYNKTLFDNEGIKYPPVDWDDRSWTYERMIDHARRLTKNPGTPEAIYGLLYGPQAPTQWAWNFGGDAYLPEHYSNGIAEKTNVDSQATIAGAEFAQDARWKQQVSPRTGVDPTTGIGFIQGRYAMVLGGGWNFWGYTVIKDFKWAAAAVPHKTNNKNVNYNDFWELSSQSKNKEAAWAFIKQIASAEVQREYSVLTGTPPTQKAAVEAWYKRYEGLMTRDEIAKVTQQAIDPRRSQESPDHLFVNWDQMSRYFSENVGGPIDRNEGKPRDVIARAKPGYDAVVKQTFDEFKGKTPT